ncbi:hypothetical protein Mal4_43770 [Maioricimonas rarisocia]|uniref:Ser-Thr-rich glycosyl-phosphatidyl-inositol-anchored membrane family protein n=1 Tax=Maioricimonas rarisocia TaxID=2528026 RepID=A0A517ZC00_9PLAN|nr:hypothetical protein [Maioricimonas rarisocia]QDU40023.1 hypothetical protein Mal4_43770 [Maioricimonas rarisocia]
MPVVLAILVLSMTSELAIAAPVHTSRPRFRIPFQFDSAEIQRLGAVEIQLYVSSDRGVNWRHVQSVSPTAGKFTFEAEQDGEYWFAVRTLDGRRQQHPGGPLQAGLQVVVDQQQPELEVGLTDLQDGRVLLSWRAVDAHLDAETLSLEFFNVATSRWEGVNVTAAANGQTSWSVKPGQLVSVRGQVADRAGNTATSEASVTIDGTSSRPRDRDVPDFSKPVAEGPGSSELAGTPPSFDGRITPVEPTPRAQFPQIRSGNSPQQLVTSDASRPPALAKSLTRVEGSVPTRRVNSRTFNISYAFDNVGPSGVGDVDLYISENGGLKWYHYGSDPDRRSPMSVTVPKDGDYGFALRVHSGVGIAATPPQPEEKPAFRIVVDQTPPKAQLYPLVQGQGSAHNKVEIQWVVTDELLADKPIALFYALQSTGPWEPIATGLDNTGRYVWTLGLEAAQKIYVRIDARDAAGNVTRVEVNQPLVIDMSTPTARILDVETLRSPQ